MVEAFAALGESNRFRIVELLRSGARTVNDIGERLQLNQPQVSKHLRVLKDAGLVDVEPRAQQRMYELSGPSLRQLHDWLERYRAVWELRFAVLDDLLVELEAAKAPGPKPSSAKPSNTKQPKEKTKEKSHGRTKRQ
jgi:DNA-binding transcriptional ArsR family regulator